MAEPLHALTALGRAEPHAETIGTLRLTERVDLALASVAIRKGREGDVAAAAAAAGIPLPPPARRAGGQTFAAFWVAPGMWFLEAPFATHEDIAARLRPIFGEAASITEQTDAWICLDLAAPDLVPLFERLCAVDLAAAPDGLATRTVIEHLGCYLIVMGRGAVRLYGGRSSAGSLVHAIAAAAASIG